LFAHLEIFDYIVVPFTEDLVLYHLHLIVAFTVFPQFRVFPYVFQENLFDLSTLSLRNSLWRCLGGRRKVHFPHRRPLGCKIVQFISASLQTDLFSTVLQSLQIFDLELRQIRKRSQQRHTFRKVCIFIVILQVKFFKIDEGIRYEGATISGGVALEVVLHKDQIILQLVYASLELVVLLPQSQTPLQQIVCIQCQSSQFVKGNLPSCGFAALEKTGPISYIFLLRLSANLSLLYSVTRLYSLDYFLQLVAIAFVECRQEVVQSSNLILIVANLSFHDLDLLDSEGKKVVVQKDGMQMVERTTQISPTTQ